MTEKRHCLQSSLYPTIWLKRFICYAYFMGGGFYKMLNQNHISSHFLAILVNCLGIRNGYSSMIPLKVLSIFEKVASFQRRMEVSKEDVMQF